jgi:hypothetical protein
MLLKFGTTNMLTLALALGVSAVTYAQNSDLAGAPQQVQQAVNPAGVSNEDLEKFANVNVRAHEIEDKYSNEINGAKTLDDVEEVQKKMNNELVDAIHREDLSVEEYQQVGTAVQQDPELRMRATHMITEKLHKTGN